MASKAKDPAVLWYWNDWHGGTITFSRHLKGCYMDLLYAQFNNGHLSLEEIRTVLGTDFSHWDTLQKKFARDAAGKFFNEKLDRVKAERKAFSEKQSLRAKNGWDKRSGNAAALPIENENANEVVKDLKKVCAENISELRTDVIFHEQVCMATGLAMEKTKKYLETFISQKIIGDELAKPLNDCRSHFVNWVKIEIKKEERGKPGQFNGKFPDYYDDKLVKTMDGAQLSKYRQHLHGLGLVPKKNRFQEVIDYIPKEQAS